MEKRRRRSSGWKGSSPSCPNRLKSLQNGSASSLPTTVTGVGAHDARIVAAMSVPGVRRLLTYNLQDFARYKQIETIRPQ